MKISHILIDLYIPILIVKNPPFYKIRVLFYSRFTIID